MSRRSPKADHASPPDKKRGQEEARALLRLVERADGFALAFVRGNAPLLTAKFLDSFELELAAIGKKLQRLHLEARVENLLDELLAIPPEANRVIAVTGLEYSVSADRPATLLHRMNLQREGFRRLNCPLLIFVPDYIAGLLGREAPDLWSWKTSYFDVGEDHVDLLPGAFGLTLSADPWGYSALDEKTRIAELEYQQRLWPQADERHQIEIALRQSTLLESLGRLAEARKVLRELALPICSRLGDLRGQGLALLRVVYLERKLGHAKKARRILEEEVLPGAESVDRRLFWQAQIERAELLRELGSKQAARRLLQKTILPVVELESWQPELPMARLLLAMMMLDGETAGTSRFVESRIDPIFSEIQTAGLGTSYELLKIALAEREGRWDEVISRIDKNVLPQLERQGDFWTLAQVRADLAWRLLLRNTAGDLERADKFLEQAVATADNLEMPELEQWKAQLSRLQSARI